MIGGAATAHATDYSGLTVPTTIGGVTYTHLIKGCATNLGQNPCQTFVIAIFNDSAYTIYQAGNIIGPTVGSVGGLTVSTTTTFGSGYEAGVFSTMSNVMEAYPCTDATYTNCSTLGLNSNAFVGVLNDPTYNPDAQRWIYSTVPLYFNGVNIASSTSSASAVLNIDIPTFGQVVATTSSTSVGQAGVSPACYTTDCTNGLGLVTGTTLSFSGYVDPRTLTATGTQLEIQATIYPAGTGFSGVSTYIIPIDLSTLVGPISESTTTSIVFGGGNQIRASLVQISTVYNVGWECLWGILDCATSNQKTLAATTTTFQVGGTALSASDLNYLNNLGTPQGIVNSLSSTTQQLASSCDPLSGFNIGNCLVALIVPAPVDLNNDVTLMQGAVLTRAPFGWVERIVNLIATSSTSTLPVVSYTFQNDSPLNGTNISFDVGANMTAASDFITNQATSDISGNKKNVWQIMQPVVDLFVYVFLLYVMIRDVTGLRVVPHNKD